MSKTNNNSTPVNSLNSLIKGERICHLCLRRIDENFFSSKDLVFLRNKEHVSVNTILCTVLKAPSITNFTLVICTKCLQEAVLSYNFIRQCQKSSMLFNQAIDLVTTCLDEVSENSLKSKTMYCTIDFAQNISHNYFDKKTPPPSIPGALKRIKAKINKKQKNEYSDTEVYNNCVVNEDVFACQHCAKSFQCSKGLKAHYQRVHAPKDFKCPNCTRKFGSEYLLKLHKTQSHITVICSECGKTYNNMHSLKLHEASHHFRLICSSCGGVYKNRISFERHQKQCGFGPKESLAEKFICDICSKEYSQKCSLRVHITFEHGHGKSFSCNWCQKKFPAISKLKAHTVKHTKERNFICNICGGRFVTKESLLYHTRIHTGEAPYSCSQCDEKFISASRRMDHIRRKHIGATLECEVCNKMFKTPLCLKKHKKRHSNPHSSLFVTQINK